MKDKVFAITEKHYNKVTFTNNTCQILSINTDALMNSVPTIFGYLDMRGDMAFLSSEILSLR